MNITQVKKVVEGTYNITSLECPSCNDTATIEITGDELYRINRGERNVLAPRISTEVRERFISGYCSPCWSDLFGSDEGDE